ncbi:nitrilotriacetate monooxygenase component A [Burkholderia pseudomallei]|nr:nitrilotriacetate monooxygenase component A [Burkholderia pseudomallei]
MTSFSPLEAILSSFNWSENSRAGQAQGLDDFVELVIPALEARGRYRRTLVGSTLRDHLGLPRKESRRAAAAPA